MGLEMWSMMWVIKHIGIIAFYSTIHYIMYFKKILKLMMDDKCSQKE